MQYLINIEQKQIGTQFVQSVYARDLHAFLENKDMFAHWIKDRISQFGFVENQDFVSFWENPQKPQGGRPSEEYHLTLDMAKELSMVERTPKLFLRANKASGLPHEIASSPLSRAKGPCHKASSSTDAATCVKKTSRNTSTCFSCKIRFSRSS